MTQKMSGITTQHTEKIAELACELTRTVRRSYPANPIMGAQIHDILEALAVTTVNLMHSASGGELADYDDFFLARFYEFHLIAFSREVDLRRFSEQTLAQAQVLEDAVRAAKEVIDDQR